MATKGRSVSTQRGGNTLVNVLIGAGVALVLSMVAPMLGQVVGGGVAGYLQKEGETAGAKVGGIAGLVSAIPGLLLAGLVIIPFVFLPLLGGDLAGFAIFSGVGLVFLLVIAASSILFSGILGAVGGYVGAMLYE